VDATVTGSGTAADPWLLSGNNLVILRTNADQLRGVSTVKAASPGVQELSNQATGGTFSITASLSSRTETLGVVDQSRSNVDHDPGQVYINSQTFHGLSPVSFTFFATGQGQYLTPMVFEVVDGTYTLAAVYSSIQVARAGLNTVPLTQIQGSLDPKGTYVFGFSERQVSLNGTTLGNVEPSYAGTVPYARNTSDSWLFTTGHSVTADYVPALGQTFATSGATGTYRLDGGRGYSASVTLAVNALTATTSYLPYNADASEVRAALDAVGIETTVTGSGTTADPWVISNSRLSRLTTDDLRLQGGSISREENPSWTTASIPRNASAADLQTALNALPGVDVYVSGSGTQADPWVISGIGLGTLTINDAGLIGGTSHFTAGTTGDVKIVASGDLFGSNSLPTGVINVRGNSITLTSTGGSVGAINNPLMISAQGTAQANGGTLGGVVNISAANNIQLIQQGGDLRVGQIASSGGGRVSL
ncbi:hypothetical protein ACYOEI_32160, partial [Singulisphaera rosea]